MKKGKVSVVIPVYNNARFLSVCLDSVIGQTYRNLEIIVVDDASTDGSSNIIDSFNDKRMKVIRLKKNSGVAVARNRGVKIATGDFICFLDADDYWSPEKVEKQVELMLKNNYAFSYTGYAYLRGEKARTVRVPERLDYKTALKNTTIFTSTVMLNMKSLDKKCIYMPEIKYGQDTATWWNILRKGVTAYGVDEALAYYRVGNSGSLSHNKFKSAYGTWQIYKMQNLSLIKRVCYFACYVKNATVRRLGAK